MGLAISDLRLFYYESALLRIGFDVNRLSGEPALNGNSLNSSPQIFDYRLGRLVCQVNLFRAKSPENKTCLRISIYLKGFRWGRLVDDGERLEEELGVGQDALGEA